MFEVRVDWYGEQRKKEIRYKINNGVVKATRFLWRQIKNEVGYAWGSNYITSFKRKMYRVSRIGKAPLMQTGNLEKSFKFNFNMNAEGYIIGSITSDAPYAPTLEKGGTLQIDQADKKHTRVRLVNPIKRALTIAARPFARPTLHKNKDRLIKIIMRG